jgi:hypothetical protein
MGYSLRTPEYRYIEWRNTEDMSVVERELYRMDDDHIEKQNLAGNNKFADTMDSLSGKIDEIKK